MEILHFWLDAQWTDELDHIEKTLDPIRIKRFFDFTYTSGHSF